MTARVKWIDRRFNFDFPADIYPEITARLRGTPARVEDIIKGVPNSVLTARPETGWSIQEQIGHLVSVELLLHGRLDDYAADKMELRAADMTNQHTEKARYNEQPLDSVLTALRNARNTSVHRLEGLTPEDFRKPALHPRLQVPMRLVDAMYFFAEHDDFHLARISELIRESA